MCSATASKRIGFVSTRIRGTDGVSLEIAKWADILHAAGHECFYVCGQSDRPAERTVIIELAGLFHPVIAGLNQLAFGAEVRPRKLTQQLADCKEQIKDELYAAIDALRLDVLIAENALTIPMNIPLGLALVDIIQETGIPCLAHHHDFVWERERFLVNCVDDYLQAAFPPALTQIEHVVINSVAGEEFSRRTGMSCHVIPNVMDFAHPPAPPDEYALSFRDQLGIGADDWLILQPTRIVARKGIEHTIELVRQLNDQRCKLVITHDSGDEGDQYRQRIVEYADLMGVELILAQQWISDARGTRPDGTRLYSVWDAYRNADLISYPSTYEGFGNAFLEAVYFGKPLFCNRYSIFRTDIEPCGLQVALMDGFLTDQVVEEVRAILEQPERRAAMAQHNYAIGQTHFGYDRAAGMLKLLLERPQSRCSAAGGLMKNPDCREDTHAKAQKGKDAKKQGK